MCLKNLVDFRNPTFFSNEKKKSLKKHLMVVASNENRLLNLSKIEVTGLAGISITLGKMDYVSPTDHKRCLPHLTFL